MEQSEIGKYLIIDPKVCHGKLTFKGTRVPVGTVLTFLSMGDSIDDILRNWPELTREAVEEAIRLAADIVHERYPGKIKSLRSLENFFACLNSKPKLHAWVK